MRWRYPRRVLRVCSLTWVFSGLLSMEPFDWTNARGLESARRVLADRWRSGLSGIRGGRVGARGPHALKSSSKRIKTSPTTLRYTAAPSRRREARRLHQPTTSRAAHPETHLIDATTLRVQNEPFSVDSLLARLRAGAPGAAIVEHELLSDYDAYYYSRGREAPLPVLRVKFDDPMQTWVYVDPATSEQLAAIHRLNRVERWLYNGLHSLDFGFWYDRRPLWDIGMIVLCAGALASSAIGFYLGLKRVRRDLSRVWQIKRRTVDRERGVAHVARDRRARRRRTVHDAIPYRAQPFLYAVRRFAGESHGNEQDDRHRVDRCGRGVAVLRLSGVRRTARQVREGVTGDYSDRTMLYLISGAWLRSRRLLVLFGKRG